MLVCTLLWLVDLALPSISLPGIGSPFIPQGGGLILGATCLVQFGFSKWLDGRYETGLGRNYYWMIWYPIVFWVINIATTVAAYPRVLARGGGKRARWISPDRGVRPGGGT